MVVVDEVGLITCERMILGKGTKVLIRKYAGFLSPTWKKKVKSRRMKRKMREKMEAKSRRESRRESKQPHHERMRMG